MRHPPLALGNMGNVALTLASIAASAVPLGPNFDSSVSHVLGHSRGKSGPRLLSTKRARLSVAKPIRADLKDWSGVSALLEMALIVLHRCAA
jgi:hypothetical protein